MCWVNSERSILMSLTILKRLISIDIDCMIKRKNYTTPQKCRIIRERDHTNRRF